MFTETDYRHIQLDESQTPRITGANFKVIMLVKEYLLYGWSPEELKYQHPQLEMAQIHAALAYFYDHQDGMLQQIKDEDATMENFLKSRTT